VAAMQEALEDRSTPRRLCRYAVADDPPIQEMGAREGKRRLRIDIEVIRTGHGPRPRFQFEAKRLRQANSESVADYLGPEGLGCFVSGRYARGQPEAGMLGYVQSDDGVLWAARICDRLREEPSRHSVTPDGAPTAVTVHAALPHSFRSRHERLAVGTAIVVYHTMLRMTPT